MPATTPMRRPSDMHRDASDKPSSKKYVSFNLKIDE